MISFLKPLIVKIFSSINLEKIRERVKKNFEYVVKDDEIVLDVIFGYDNKSQVIVIMTNNHLYVMGDILIHKIKRNNIEDISVVKGLFAKLIKVTTIDDTQYFKVYSKRGANALKEWL
jgi:predicted transcriptional regulator